MNRNAPSLSAQNQYFNYPVTKSKETIKAQMSEPTPKSESVGARVKQHLKLKKFDSNEQ